jgi:fructose-1,6-bisphosphatase/sedoheptulose 1,7-bisphosphatase-like protein
MARQAEADGVAAICATPHIRADHAVAIAELPARRTELSAALLEAGCRTRVLPGGEVAAGMLDALDEHELASVVLGGGGAGSCSSRSRGRSTHASETRWMRFGAWLACAHRSS